MGKRYGQFCPVAMASEVLCERWVPLVLREVMYGSSRFNEIARGVPLMSRALLTRRLRDLDDALLMWALRRYLRLPGDAHGRVVLRFDFYGLPRSARVARRSWWLLANPSSEAEICVKDPGYDTDIVVSADLLAFTEILLGRRPLAAALREGCVKLQGPPSLVRELPRWLPLSGEAMHSLGVAVRKEAAA